MIIKDNITMSAASLQSAYISDFGS